MKQKLLAYGLVMLLTIVLAQSGFAASQRDKYQADISKILNGKWQSYSADKPNWGGGLALYIISPKGSFYATNIPSAEANTRFRCASVTKTFTAAAIMLLDQQGKLNINDLITANIPGSTEPYVPNTADYKIPYKDKITIKMILRHRAGIFDVDNSPIPTTEAVPYAGQSYVLYTETASNEHTFTFDELVGVDARLGLSYFAPDTDYHYSDTGYSLLGKIIERVTGRSYGEFVRENLLAPNGLTGTSLPYLGGDNKIPAPFEPGYSYYNGQLADVTEDNMSCHVAEGNAITTPSDLANWLRRLFKGRAGLAQTTVNMMTAEASGKAYGLGLSATSGLGYGHNGGTNGYITVARCDPKQDVTVVMSASVINWNDYEDEIYTMYDIARAAKNSLGYSTAEAY